MSMAPPILSTVPPEIVYEILTYQFRDFMNNDQPSTSEKFNENLRNFLRSNLTVNKTFHHICTILVYKYCNLTTAKRFHALLSTIAEHKELRNIIQVADFQELTSIGLGRSKEMNKMIKNLTNDTLLQFLKLTKSNLREFLACEHIQDDLDDKIIHFLLKPGKVLSIVDFCGCSGPNFTKSFILAFRKLFPLSTSSANNTNILTDDDNISIASFSTINSSDLNELEENDIFVTPDDTNMLQPPIESNYQITCLGLNDCTDLPNFVIGRILKLLPDLQKLDLSRTSIDDNILINILPHLKNLSHLSLANCSQLSPRAILEFFSHHPAVTDENNDATLEWLNLSVIAHSGSWNAVHTMFLLKKLCQYGHNKTLQYLNIGGFPLNLVTETARPPMSRSNSSASSISPQADNSIYSHVVKTNHFYQCTDTLMFIKLNFPNLKSLSIRGNNVPMNKLVEFLTPIEYLEESNDIFRTMGKQQELKFLNISNNSHINKWTIQDTSLVSCSNSLVALEISFDAWHQVEKSNANNEINIVKYNKKTNKNDLIKWKCYIDSSYGRRYWIYKTDRFLNREDINSTESNLTRFDEHGNKIIKIFRQPDFLKYAQIKISLSCGLVTKSRYIRKHCYRDVKPPISQFLTKNGGIAFGSTFTPIVRPILPPGGWRILPDEHDEDNEHTDESDSNDDSGAIGNNTTLTSGRDIDPNDTSDINHEIGNALYWDRSISDLAALSRDEEERQGVTLGHPSPIAVPERANTLMRPPIAPVASRYPRLPTRLQSQPIQQQLLQEEDQNDEEYLNNPELQRRRSELQLGILRSRTPLQQNPRLRTINKSNTSSSNNIPTIRSRINRHRAHQHGHNHKMTTEYYCQHPDEFVYDPTDEITSERYRIHFQQVHEYKTFGCIERGMYRYYSLKM